MSFCIISLCRNLMMKVDIQKFLKDFSCLSWCFCSKIQTEITNSEISHLICFLQKSKWKAVIKDIITMLFFCCSSGFPWVTDTDAAEFLIVTIFQNHVRCSHSPACSCVHTVRKASEEYCHIESFRCRYCYGEEVLSR